MSKEDILERIKNILAKTVANGATEEEEQSAILMAQRLAAKYQVNLDELEEDEYKIDELAMEFGTKSVSAIQKLIVTELMPHFGVRALLKHSMKGAILFTVGESYKCKIFKESVQYVYNAFQFHWRQYHQSLNIPTSAKNDARGSFLKGFLSGYTQKLVEQEQKYALVIVESHELQQYMKEHTKGKSKFHVRDDGQAMDYLRGYQAGSSSYQKHTQLQSA